MIVALLLGVLFGFSIGIFLGLWLGYLFTKLELQERSRDYEERWLVAMKMLADQSEPVDADERWHRWKSHQYR